MITRLATPRLLSLACAALWLLLPAAASAQGLMEALQKQVWPQARPWSPADWAVLLPAADTLWLPGDSLAEAITLDAAGRPVQVQALARTHAGWAPVRLCEATYDTEGHLLQLLEWSRVEAGWQPAARMVRTRLQGLDWAFTFQTQVAGEWKMDYAWQVAENAYSCSATRQP